MDPILWKWSVNEVVGYAIGLFMCLAFGVYLYTMKRPRWYKRILLLGLFVRAMASALFIDMMSVYYGGGDFDNYMQHGYRLYNRFLSGGWAEYTDTSYWLHKSFWGTQVVNYITSVVGIPMLFSMHGLSLLFAILSYIGCILFAEAFANVFPRENLRRYLWLVIFMPSLTFWPSVLGKDALVILGMGMVFLGYSRRSPSYQGTRSPWLLIVSGVALIGILRPQVAAIAAISLGLGYWLSRDRRWTPSRVAASLGILVVLGWVSVTGLRMLGVEDVSTQGVSNYVELKAENSGEAYSQSGVAVNQTTNPIQAIVNSLFRPFIWESGSITLLLSALEILFIWLFVIYRFKNVIAFFQRHKKSEYLISSMFFILLYSMGLGMTLANMGLLVRQRMIMYPALLLVVSASFVKQHAGSFAIRPAVRSWRRGPSEKMALNLASRAPIEPATRP